MVVAEIYNSSEGSGREF